MRVIHLPSTVGGNPQGISRHLNQLGVQSETWTIRQNYLAYPVDKVISGDSDNMILREVKKLFALRYVFRCDLVFFNVGSGLYCPFFSYDNPRFKGWKKALAMVYRGWQLTMARLEVSLLRLMKIPVFIQYQGDDARQGDYSRENFRITFVDRVEAGYYTKASDEAKRKSIRFYAGVAEKIYALNPDLLHMLPGRAEFLPYSHISLNEWAPHYTQLDERPLRIGHAPSHRSVKGTELVIEAVGKLQQAGYDLELVLVEGMSNAKAKEMYETVDIVVDQLFAGWYGGLAVEAMALGKPVIAYIREEDLHLIPAAMREELPIIRSEPDGIYQALESLTVMPRPELLNLARRSRAYVERWHDPVNIAKRIKYDMETALEKRRACAIS